VVERQTALVTGAAGAIGSQVVRTLTTLGFHIAAHDRAEPSEPLGAFWLQGEITGKSGRAAVREAHERLGHLDVLIHCAGGADRHPFLDMTDTAWDEVLELNGSATFRVCQEAARAMATHGGRIVVISSLCARLAWDGFSHYCAAKAATEILCRSMAVELGPHGITVNAILPGTIRTPMTDHVGMDSEDIVRLENRTPLARMGTPEEVAAVVGWLARDAPQFLTGESLVVDGGYSIEGTP
jgi:3-oxoacyl-[acyl-carrier protein] reductase